MTPEPIAFLDSGVGGLPYLARARERLPGTRFVYVADRENFPYGEKPRAAIVAAVSSVAERVIARENPRVIVIACNTASVVALPALRARYRLPFVGVVPAVKPAAALSRSRRVGVLATQRTVEGEYLKNLIESHAAGCEVVSVHAAGLVEFVERDLANASAEERTERVRREVQRFRAERIDTLVLGCTHFLHLEPEFRKLLEEEGILLVDSREGVARQVARLAGQGGKADGRPASDSLYVTGSAPIQARYGYFAESFGMRLEGAL